MALFVLSLLLFIAVGIEAELLTHQLNHVWTNREIQSPLAQKIRDHQNQCTSKYVHHKLTNFGMGADIHVWTQALCIAMQEGLTLSVQGEDWLWNDKKICIDDADATSQPLKCYFTLETNCSSSTPLGYTPALHWQHGVCSKYISDHASRQAFRASAVEYLFSNLNPELTNTAERAVPEVFGPSGIPADLITVHIRLGDKATETKLVEIPEYIDTIEKIVDTKNMTDPHLYITTESLEGLVNFQDEVAKRGKAWKIHYYSLSVYPVMTNISPMEMAANTAGSQGLHSLVSLLLAMEGRYYVLTTGSNWSRVINELRTNVVDLDCHHCTELVDLREGSW